MAKDNLEEKMRNMEEWNNERSRVKPFIDIAVDFHNRARTEARWKNCEKAIEYYKEALVNYKNAVSQNPKYYLQDLLERIDSVIGEYINSLFDLRISAGKLQSDEGINDFLNFVDNLQQEERKYIDPYDIAKAYLSIADFYYESDRINDSYKFYNKVVETKCGRPFINREAYYKLSKIQFDQKRYKEAVVTFVTVLSYDRGNKEVINYIVKCLEALHVAEHKEKFLRATPLEAKKLIMEVL